jgi:acyl-CoA dehydrogenase
MSAQFHQFQARFKKGLYEIFNTEDNINQLSINRGLPQEVWDKIMHYKPLSVAVPKEYGGGGVNVKECLAMISTASYESLPLALTFGINVGLFLQPFAKYGNPELKPQVFNDFINNAAMGGLMITEPDFGSDALNMQTCYSETEQGYHIKGVKHWQGLTGMAKYWIVAARKENTDGKLAKDLSFFVSDNSQPDQQIEVKKYFNNLGLYMIPYGLNEINISVPSINKLESRHSGVKMMLDILHRSRLQFAAMGVGFIQRMLDEAILHCNNRKVGIQPLSSMDSVRYQISRIQSAFTLASAMCAHSTTMSGIDNDVSGAGILANSLKALVSDLMQESAQICVQLSGSGGYKLDHIAGRGIVDSRPFQIFEGSNEMLYAQVAESALKLSKKLQFSNLYDFLLTYEDTKEIAPLLKQLVNFRVPENMAQRQYIVLGRVIARIISLQLAQRLVEKGYRKDLFENCLKHIQMDLSNLLSDVHNYNNAEPILDYQDNSCWWKII